MTAGFEYLSVPLRHTHIQLCELQWYLYVNEPCHSSVYRWRLAPVAMGYYGEPLPACSTHLVYI